MKNYLEILIAIVLIHWSGQVFAQCTFGISGELTDITCHNGTDGAIQLFVTGAPDSITYLWNNGATTKDLSGLAPGSYIVNATDTVGCIVSDTFDISDPPAVNAIISGDTTICNGSTTNLTVDFIGGTSPYSFMYTDGVLHTTISNINSPSYTFPVSPSFSTIYSLETVSDLACSNTIAGSVSIIVNSTPFVNDPLDQIVCNGDPISPIHFTGAAASYIWTNSDPSIGLASSGTGDIPQFVATNSTASPVTATITVTPYNGCYGASQTFTITVNPRLKAAITSGNANICGGVSTLITGTVVANGTWVLTLSSISDIATGTGSGNFNISVSPNSTTTYTILSLNAGTCPATPGDLTGSETVTVGVIPFVNFTPNKIVCKKTFVNSITFAGNADLYSWTNNNTNIGLAASGTSATDTFTSKNNTPAPITSTITVTPHIGNCTGTPQSFTITVNPKPKIVTDTIITICNDFPFLYVAISATDSAIFSWSRAPVSGITPLSNSDSSNIIYETLHNDSFEPVTVNYIYTLTTADGMCSYPNNKLLLTINPTPTLSSTKDTTICNDVLFSYTAQSNTNGAQFSWNRDFVSGVSNTTASGSDGIINETLHNTSDEPVIVTYFFTLKTADSLCPNPDLLKVTVNPSPVLSSIKYDTTCNDAPFSYTATSNTNGAGISWNRDPVSGITPLTNFNSSNVIYETLHNDSDQPIIVTYIFALTTADSLCLDFDSLKLVVDPTPVLSSDTIDTICNAVPFFYIATSNTNNTGFSWSRAFVSGITPAVGSAQNDTINETLVNTTFEPVLVTYAFTIKTADGLCSNIDLLKVTVNPTPVLSSDTFETACDTILFSYVATSNTQNASFSWTRVTPTGIIPSIGSGINNMVNEVLDNTTNEPITVSYAFTLTTADGLCSNPDTLKVQVDPTPVLNSNTSITICDGQTVIDTVSSSTGNVTFSWSRDAIAGITPLNGSGTGDTINEVLNNSTLLPIIVTYTFILTTADGLCLNAQYVFVKVNPAPPLPVFFSTDTNKTPITLCQSSDDINFNVIFPKTADGVTYRWSVSPDSGAHIGNITDPNTVISFNNPGTDTITVMATNNPLLGSCIASESQIVHVNPNNNFIVERPIILKKPGPVLMYSDNSLSLGNGYQWGYDTIIAFTANDTILGPPVPIPGQVYQVFIPDSNFITAGELNTFDYAFWVLLKRDSCASKVYYNGPYAYLKFTEQNHDEAAIKVNVYPNPNDGSFNISLHGNIYGNIAIRIYNTLSRLLYESVFEKTQNEFVFKVDKLNFPDGLYMLELQSSDNQKVTARIIITN